MRDHASYNFGFKKIKTQKRTKRYADYTSGQ